MRKRCVLFDFDGVIADTERRNCAYFAQALAHFGIALTAEERRGLIGISDRVALAAYLPRAAAPVTVEDYLAVRRRIGNAYESGDLRPMPGLLPFLQGLRRAGVRTAVVSSTSARLILAGLNQMQMVPLFDAIVCGDMVEQPKPAPECYQKAMAWLGAAPAECVVLEDSELGIRAGRRAGATVIAYRGSGIPQDTAEAHLVVDTYAACAALPQWQGWGIPLAPAD